MRKTRQSILAGVAAGAILAVGGVAAVDAITESADAQSANQVTKADLDAANLRSQRAIKQATEAWNKVAKYLAEPGELIRANGPRVSQQAGVGGGLPTGLFADAAITTPKIADGAVTTPKLADGSVTEAKLEAALAARLPMWAHVNAGGGLVKARGATASSNVAVGAYRVTFNRDITECVFTATQHAAVGPTGVAVFPGTTTDVVVATQLNGGAAANRAFMLQVVC